MPELEPGEEEHDYYRFLGIVETASAEELRRRYHTLALKWHPDRHLNTPEKERQQAEEYMKRLTRAYHVLSTPGLRELYDERRHLGGLSTPHYTQHHTHAAHRPVAFTQMHSPVPPGVAAPTPSFGGQDTKGGGGAFGLAILCFLVALSCVSLLFHGIDNIIAGSLLLLGVVLFSLGGILFLQDGSILNRAVYAWLNGEPKQFRQDRWSAQQVHEHHKKTIAQNRLTPFELLVEEAMASIPQEFQEQMGNLMVMVEQEPDEETLERVGVKEGHILLGLYQGVALTKQGIHWQGQMERITIYQQTIEAYCHHDPDRIRAQVRKTVLHEVAHHFGMDHDEMPIWVK
jgi:predicted Zn-dependent protease with MMP-like domain/curved DNA-binding protein CbpA